MPGFWILSSLLLLTSIDVAECEETAEVDHGSCLLQKGMRKNKAVATQIPLTWASGPWDQYLYVFGSHHKSGTYLLLHMMRPTFDTLGANYSCYEGPFETGGKITSVGGRNKCWVSPHLEDCPIRWNYQSAAETFRAGRHGTANKEMRAVHIIRDPFDMLASSYCFHHAGKEPFLAFAPSNITLLNATEGVPIIAEYLSKTLKDMTEAYLVSGKDTFTIRYENITQSSTAFDLVVADMFEFLFGGLINDSSMQLIKELAKKEDLNRGMSNAENHVSDEDCEAAARAAIPLIRKDLLLQFQGYRQVLGYTPSAA